MQDVQLLFIGALKIRRICFITCIATVCIMCILNRRTIRTYVHSIFISLISITCTVTGLFVYILSDFNRAFIGFHHLLFDNDLWLLNPESDWIIRLLPEGFFSDMAISIGSFFAITLACTLAVCGLFLACTHTKDRNKCPDKPCEI